MKVHGITYTDKNMEISASRLMNSMMVYGVDTEKTYRPHDLGEDFYCDNSDVLESERGCGYWLWKPYVINRAIQLLKEGDILIYADAGVEFVAPVSHIIDKMDEDIFFFSNGHQQIKWCKMDVMAAMYPSHNNQWWYTNISVEHNQVQASVIFFKVNDKTRQFVKEWLLWCQMPGFIDDSPSKLINYSDFIEHRHDQAILTCLQIKYGYKLHWWPTQYSGHIRIEGDNYPVLFNHHRLRNNEYANELNPSY